MKHWIMFLHVPCLVTMPMWFGIGKYPTTIVLSTIFFSQVTHSHLSTIPIQEMGNCCDGWRQRQMTAVPRGLMEDLVSSVLSSSAVSIVGEREEQFWVKRWLVATNESMSEYDCYDCLGFWAKISSTMKVFLRLCAIIEWWVKY